MSYLFICGTPTIIQCIPEAEGYRIITFKPNPYAPEKEYFPISAHDNELVAEPPKGIRAFGISPLLYRSRGYWPFHVFQLGCALSPCDDSHPLLRFYETVNRKLKAGLRQPYCYARVPCEHHLFETFLSDLELLGGTYGILHRAHIIRLYSLCGAFRRKPRNKEKFLVLDLERWLIVRWRNGEMRFYGRTKFQ